MPMMTRTEEIVLEIYKNLDQWPRMVPMPDVWKAALRDFIEEHLLSLKRSKVTNEQETASGNSIPKTNGCRIKRSSKPNS